jgi:hypothetical protein
LGKEKHGKIESQSEGSDRPSLFGSEEDKSRENEIGKESGEELLVTHGGDHRARSFPTRAAGRDPQVLKEGEKGVAKGGENQSPQNPGLVTLRRVQNQNEN